MNPSRCPPSLPREWLSDSLSEALGSCTFADEFAELGVWVLIERVFVESEGFSGE